MRGSGRCGMCSKRMEPSISWCTPRTGGPAYICFRNSAGRSEFEATDEGIQDLIAILKALPPGHPLENLLHEAPDFQQEAELADALLNPQDRAYSVPQLFNLIERAGLRFSRWVKQAPYLPQCSALANIELNSRMVHLPLVEQYAAVELFRGTLVRHSVILCRYDSPFSPHPVSFTGDAWSHYIPLHMSDTICVKKGCLKELRRF